MYYVWMILLDNFFVDLLLWMLLWLMMFESFMFWFGCFLIVFFSFECVFLMIIYSKIIVNKILKKRVNLYIM